MTIAEARAIADSVGPLAEAIEPLQTPAKYHGVKWAPRIDPVRHAWEALNRTPFPTVLLTRSAEVDS